ncbi:MAG: ABC transporter permease [Candidatus Pacebacteria bacterium]|jgi:ABC-type polysaccharide/polyol phosphate export permease|nr:ABC transporter permease [Candidatus Paceibacterota bacterium]
MKLFFKISAEKKYWLELLLLMTNKEIKARYKNAYLGFVWILMNPLLQMFFIGLVFQFFIPVNIDNYFLFLFTGLLPWNFFSISLEKTTSSIVYERSIIKKSSFPKEIIPFSIILSDLFHFLVSLLLLMSILIGDKVFFEDFNFIQLILYIINFIKIIPFIIWLVFLLGGLSLLFSSLNTKYRDINFIVKAFLPLWFYATPIIYTLDLLPSYLHLIFYINPIVAIIEGFQSTLLGLEPTNFLFIAISLIITFIFFILGINVFFRESKFFDDWV